MLERPPHHTESGISLMRCLFTLFCLSVGTEREAQANGGVEHSRQSMLDWAAFVVRAGLLRNEKGRCTLPMSASSPLLSRNHPWTRPSVDVDCRWLLDFVQAAQPGTKNCKGPFTAADGDTLRVAVYGSSVSLKRQGQIAMSGYVGIISSLLNNLGMSVSISNLAIGGTGPEIWTVCPPAVRHHVLISEYTISEQDPSILKRWYKLLPQLADYIVILNLFSWLTPGEVVQPIDTFPSPGGPFDGQRSINSATTLASSADHTLCVVDIAKAAKPYWPSRHPVTTRMLWPHVPRTTDMPCHEYVEHANRSGLIACRTSEANAMQHGGSVYHSLVGVALAWHLAKVGVVDPRRLITPPFDESALRCYTSACRPEIGAVCPGAQSDKSGRFESGPVPISALRWHGDFEYGWLFNEFKPSLHALIPNASLRIAVPSNADRMWLGYMGHTVKAEAAIFTVGFGNKTSRIFTCKDPCPETGPRLRTRQWHAFTLPERNPIGEAQLDILVLWLAGKEASVEVTDVIFNTHGH